MHLRLLFLLCILFASPSWAQTQSDTIEAATLGVVEKLYETGEAFERRSLSDYGKTDRDIDLILDSAYVKMAQCFVSAAQAQAREQGLSEDVVLKIISEKIIIDETETKIMHEIDWDALNTKQAPCSTEFYADMRRATQS